MYSYSKRRSESGLLTKGMVWEGYTDLRDRQLGFVEPCDKTDVHVYVVITVEENLPGGH